MEALAGWGPAESAAAEMLATVAHTARPDLALRCTQLLCTFGTLPSPAALAKLIVSQDLDISKAAVDAFLAGHPLETAIEDAVWRTCALLTIQRLPYFAWVRVQLDNMFGWPESDQLLALRLMRRNPPDAPLARRLLPFRDHEKAEFRLAFMHAYVALRGKGQLLAPLLIDPDERVRSAALEQALVDFRLLASSLDVPAVLSQLETVLLHYLKRGERRRVDAIVRKLPDLPTLLQLDSIRWDNWETFNQTQRDVAVALMRYHRHIPAEVLQFQDLGVEVLKFMSEIHPRPSERLQELYIAALPAYRGDVALALRQLGHPGWLALAKFAAATPDLARHAVGQLAIWARAEDLGEWIRQLQPEFLTHIGHPALRATAAEAFAARLLHADEPDPRDAAWTVQLCGEQAPVRDRALRYLHHLYNTPLRRPLLDAVLHAVQHACADLRKEMLTALRLWKPYGVRQRIRALPPDPEPALRLRRLFLLNDYGPLTATELQTIDELREHPDFARDIQLQLRSWTE